METDVFFSSSGKRFLLWVVGFRCRSFVTVHVLNSIRTTAQITKQKNKPENVGQTSIKCQVPSALKSQMSPPDTIMCFREKNWKTRK